MIKDRKYIGFDCEWKPVRRVEDEHFLVHVVQIATETDVFVFSVGTMPDKLKYILENEEIYKVTKNPRMDRARLSN